MTTTYKPGDTITLLDRPGVILDASEHTLRVSTITVTCLDQLRVGDKIHSWDGHPYNPPRIVTHALAPLEPGSSVKGVRLANPNPVNQLEYVLYPSQMNGLPLVIERDSEHALRDNIEVALPYLP